MYVKSPEAGQFYAVNSNALETIENFEDDPTQDEFKEPPGFGEMFLFKSSGKFYRAYRFRSNPADPTGIRAFLIDVGVEIYRAFKSRTFYKMPLRFLLVPPLAIFCELQTDQPQSKATLLIGSLNKVVTFTVRGKKTAENNLGPKQKCLKVALELTAIQMQEYDVKLFASLELVGCADVKKPVVSGPKLKKILGAIKRTRLTIITEGDEEGAKEPVEPEAGIELDNDETLIDNEFIEPILKISPKKNATDEEKLKMKVTDGDDAPDDIFWKATIKYVPQLTYLKRRRLLENGTADPIKHHAPFMANRISINYNFPQAEEMLFIVPSEFTSPSIISGKFTIPKAAVNLKERTELVDLFIWMNNQHVIKHYKKLRDPPVQGEMVLAKCREVFWCRAMVQEVTGEDCRVS